MDLKNIEILNGGISIDDRGAVRFVNDFDFSTVKRFYQVENHDINYIRAWHGHRKEGKYVYVASGSALVGVVDLDTNQVIQRIILSAMQPRILFIPPGCANGFMNLENNTNILFFSTSTIDESLNDDIRFPYDKWDLWKKDYR